MERVLRACEAAARWHAGQWRKGPARLPYVTHVLEVARRVAASPEADENTVIAALLHDVVEDTAGTAQEIAALFGRDVARIVAEVTDDKALPKAQRKALQVETVAGKSAQARRIKLADKAANLASLADTPPDWTLERRRAYLDWATAVIAGCRGLDPVLEAAFDAEADRLRARLG